MVVQDELKRGRAGGGDKGKNSRAAERYRAFIEASVRFYYWMWVVGKQRALRRFTKEHYEFYKQIMVLNVVLQNVLKLWY